MEEDSFSDLIERACRSHKIVLICMFSNKMEKIPGNSDAVKMSIFDKIIFLTHL